MIELYVAVVGVAGAIGGSIVTHFLARKRNAADIGGVLSTAGAELARSAMDQVRAMDERLSIAEGHIDDCNTDRRELRKQLDESKADRFRITLAVGNLIRAVEANGHADLKAAAITNAKNALAS